MKLGRWVDAQTSRTPAQAVELLRAMPGGPQIAAPYRYAPRSDYEAGLTTRQINAAIDAAPIADVPIASLVAGQHTVARAIVEQYLVDPASRRPRAGQRDKWHGGQIDYPIVCRRAGIDYIHDGTHRVMATALLGARLVRVRLADLDGLPKE